jgi:hypothetical protein
LRGRRETTLLALTLQALGGPLPTDDRMWTSEERNQTVAVFRSMRRRAGTHTGVSETLALLQDVLQSRALSLHTT